MKFFKNLFKKKKIARRPSRKMLTTTDFIKMSGLHRREVHAHILVGTLKADNANKGRGSWAMIEKEEAEAFLEWYTSPAKRKFAGRELV